ncbi:transporter ['Osedax' symbiont bacterium Rs2_46_30_T18]|nr:transporter ['Osedax' symbiont bacterium Rs2_46_30_T18]
MSIKRRTLLAAAITGCLLSSFSFSVAAEAKLEKIHFLIPGGAGGGWDGTARGTGEALTKSGLVKEASFQNMSGGGGGKAIAHLIETAKNSPDTLMVNSTPIVVRSITKVFPQSFRDLTPVAGTIADYGAFVVKVDSPLTDWSQAVALFKENPRKLKFAGGSARGSLDHLVAAAVIKAEGLDPRTLKYIPYDAGGKAMAGLLSGEAKILSTGLGEALALAKGGQVRILGITAPERVGDAPDVKTMTEMGNNTVFANWRGFFAAPGVSKEQVAKWNETLEAMYKTPEWETVRGRNGWVNVYKNADEFYAFLEQQEEQLGSLMKELGFLK